MKRALLSIDQFREAASAGKRPQAHLSFQFKLAAPEIAEDTRAVPFVFSDDSVDSYGDTIEAKGWIWDRSGAGTVALFGHDPSKVENIIGRAHNIRVEGNQLIGEIHFAEKDVNPQADVVYQLVKGGYLNSVSVGFQPIEWTLAKDKSRPGGIDFKKQKLLEISVVGIPANENAVAQARAAGIDVDQVIRRDAKVPTKKGLYSVSWLASILADLGWLEESVEFEAEYEGDGSDVPARLADAMNTLGHILVDMTIEEVSELLADETSESEDGLIDDVTLLAAPTEGQRAVAALAKALKVAATKSPDATVQRAGRTLSAANETKLRDAHGQMTSACDVIKGMLDSLDGDEPETTEKSDDAAAERARRAKALKLKLTV
jgi:HK97 family phage prohead protease